ncbi:uncharacterized protein N7459_007083 [Penicillium hispanicum]|uniref:uncharacterized protein n=1 Tax=Penicillium hispanicum TaxID=1080232 RepID=UPI0025414B81|nr:uncharacterized protein N7459_007083 [Penicillium hispanicum]KAJ5578119.1 hypothetical protein N7459_007083 [Penicillium hispanicum]
MSSILPNSSPTKSLPNPQPQTQPPSLLQLTVPPGWTISPDSPEYKEDWEGRDPQIQTIARCYGLGPGIPIMEDAEGWTAIFQSGDKFHLWARMSNDVEEIAFQDIHEIVCD